MPIAENSRYDESTPTSTSELDMFVEFFSNLLRNVCFVVWTFLQALFRVCTPIAWQKKKDLRGKVVLITGAGGGIGSELAKGFAREGARLILWDLNKTFNEKVEIACEELDAEVTSHSIDITDQNAVYALAEEILRDFGHVDVLVNNAGVLNASQFLESSDENIIKLMNVNVNSLFWVTKAFLPSMLKRRSGHLVCTSSVSSLIGCPGLVDYSASKFAATGFMEALHHELLNNGYPEIKFTTACPIFVHTPLIDNLHIYDSRLPVLKPESVARRIIEAVQIEQQFLCIPRDVYWASVIKAIFPSNIYQYLVLRKRFRYG